MINDEAPMTKQIRNPKSESAKARRRLQFVLRHSFVIGILSFVILLTGCHSPQEQAAPLPASKVESNRLILPENSSEFAALSIEPIEAQSNATLRLNGRLLWDDNFTVRIFTPFAVRVTRILA